MVSFQSSCHLGSTCFSSSPLLLNVLSTLAYKGSFFLGFTTTLLVAHSKFSLLVLSILHYILTLKCPRTPSWNPLSSLFKLRLLVISSRLMEFNSVHMLTIPKFTYPPQHSLCKSRLTCTSNCLLSICLDV